MNFVFLLFDIFNNNIQIYKKFLELGTISEEEFGILIKLASGDKILRKEFLKFKINEFFKILKSFEEEKNMLKWGLLNKEKIKIKLSEEYFKENLLKTNYIILKLRSEIKKIQKS